MKKSHQLLVLEDLDSLFTNPPSYPVLIAILSWLIVLLNKEYARELHGAELGIVNGQFLGDGYPTLGIHYMDMENPKDVGPLVEAAVARLLHGKTVADLIAYLAQSNVNWTKAVDEIMRDDSPGKKQA